MKDFNIVDMATQYLCLLFSICMHEAAHAYTANRCGDPSARLLGRTTLNPLAHIDPIGTVLMPIMMMLTNIPLFGWAKPVPYNPRNLHNIRRDPALIALAGPGANLCLAISAAVILRILVLLFGVAPNPPGDILFMVFVNLLIINLMLMLFNLIPVPPLDGSKLLYPFLPPSGQQMMEQIGPFGMLIVIMVGGRFLSAPLYFVLDLVLGLVFAGQR